MAFKFSACCCALAVVGVTGCMVGPTYKPAAVQVPQQFSAGVQWQRAAAGPEDALTSTWWTGYQDDRLADLVRRALVANQSIVAEQAADRVAHAVVAANVAGLLPTLSAGFSATRSGPTGTNGVLNLSTFQPAFSTNLTASWELDLWGKVRRQIESSRASAEATDADLAGERLSIAASVAEAYLQLRQADVDSALLQREQAVDAQLLRMAQADFQQGTGSHDDMLVAQDTLENAIAALQSSEAAREQYEHAIAVLIGVPPEGFGIPPEPDYRFTTPAIPLSVPSELLERRYDVVSAERTAAAANAQIGVAVAAFYPSLSLSAEAGLESNVLGQLFSLPNRFWTLGPSVAAPLFEGGARTAAVREARGTYDQAVANYKETVLSAFQSVEDSLSTLNHLGRQERAFASVYHGNTGLVASQQAQLAAGAASRQAVLTQQLTLLQAEQSLRDTEALMAQDSVVLIKNLGGGWQWHARTATDVFAATHADH